MYETHFGFHRQPFQSVDPAKLFFRSESIRGLLPRLTRCLRSSLGIGIVTALHGAGRSALLRYLKTSMEHEGRTVFVSGSSLASTTALHQLLMHCAVSHAGAALAIESVPTEVSRWSVSELLRRSMDFWGPVLLLVDDVHLAPVSVLNELRALSEEDWQGRTLVRILVTAPVAFEVDLSRPEYENFSHRIRCHEFLQPLTTKESFEFLKRQIESAGPQMSGTFTEQALELIVAASEGLPRSLCLLTDEALAVAAEGEKRPVAEDCVRVALNRMKHLSCHWNTSVLESFDDEDTWGVTGHEAGHSSTLDEEPGPVRAATAVIHRLAAGVVEFGGGASDDVPQPAWSEQGMSVTPWPAALTPPPLPPDAFENVDESPNSVTFDFSASDSGGIRSPHAVGVLLPEERTPFPGYDVGVVDDPAVDSRVSLESEGMVFPTVNTVTPVEIAAELPMPCEVSELQIDPADFSSITPVPDRYTWVALGRELFSGDFSQVEADYAGILPDPELFMPPEIFQDVTERSPISIQQMTDQQILELLGQPSPAGRDSIRSVPSGDTDLTGNSDAGAEHSSGFFHVIRPAAHSVAAESQVQRPLPEVTEPLPATARPRTAVSAAPVVDSAASSIVDEKVTLPMWRDGSLLMAIQAERRRQAANNDGTHAADSGDALNTQVPGERLRRDTVPTANGISPQSAHKPQLHSANRVVEQTPVDGDSGMGATGSGAELPDRFATLFTRLRNIRGK